MRRRSGPTLDVRLFSHLFPYLLIKSIPTGRATLYPLSRSMVRPLGVQVLFGGSDHDHNGETSLVPPLLGLLLCLLLWDLVSWYGLFCYFAYIHIFGGSDHDHMKPLVVQVLFGGSDKDHNVETLGVLGPLWWVKLGLDASK